MSAQDDQGADTAVQQEFIARADTADRLAAAYLRHVYTRPWVMVVGVVLVSAVVVVVLVDVVSWFGAMFALLAGTGFVWISNSIQRTRLRRQLRTVAGEGKRITLEAGPDSLHLAMALSEGDIDYGAFESAVASGPAVLLKTRHGNTHTILPIELFPPAVLQYVQERIAAR